jgi:phosphatidylinositol glycan class O
MPKSLFDIDGYLGSLSAQPTIVSQVDIVSTLSILLGSPTPFGNLGFVIPELFANCRRQALASASGMQSVEWLYRYQCLMF